MNEWNGYDCQEYLVDGEEGASMDRPLISVPRWLCILLLAAVVIGAGYIGYRGLMSLVMQVISAQ